MNDESILFTPIRIGTIEVKNRFVRSATHDYMATQDGAVTDRQVSLYRELARRDIGLIVSGHAFVNPEGKASPFQIGAHRDEMTGGLARIADTVHEYGGFVFLQISHAGRQTKPKLTGCTPLAPSAVYEPTYDVMPRAMSGKDIINVIKDFIHAARRAKEAGFDGVQLHMAHGYLLSSFLSPHTNRRTDEWGGPLENRLRVSVDIIKGIKDLLGNGYPLIVKLNSTDLFEGGIYAEESVEAAKVLAAHGVDGIEASGGIAEGGRGTAWKGILAEEEEGYFAGNAARMKQAVSVPVFGLGGLRTFSVMERLVSDGRVDLVSMSRPFIREPKLVKKFFDGETGKSSCISCNGCFNVRGISCSELKRSGSDHRSE
ncbi:MAG: NADH:flavin oxidoreductase [Spirochaetes bacterium]|nr:NADH:flavin oxidoreductase [Spirochaetota bacterium]